MLVSYHAATGRGGDTPTGWLRAAGRRRIGVTAGGMGSGRYGVWRTTSSTIDVTFVHVHFRVLGRVYP
jgi:hypothetical protein